MSKLNKDGMKLMGEILIPIMVMLVAVYAIVYVFADAYMRNGKGY